MKKRNRATPASPHDNHPAISQVSSEIGGESSNLKNKSRQKAKIKKGKPTVTIAPGLRSTRDIFFNRPT
ncbi:MAG: hypothetical protein ACRDBP_11510 [Luteolibacter sp.]